MTGRFTPHRSRTFAVRDFVHAVARLGRFVGRKGNGHAGLCTPGLGYHRLQDVILRPHPYTSAQPGCP